MTPFSASVIVVSRHRAEALRLCLIALSQQDHPGFEVIVVADPSGIAVAKASGIVQKLVVFDEANISAARNLGLVKAGAGIVAFIDDDAVAEPTWLLRLTQPFADPSVVAATGFVRGRNGISFQWRACEVDANGADHPLSDAAATYCGTAQRAVKTQGTNCAFRRDSLASIGGFDPAFRFFLDEADVNLRLAAFGKTAVVPDAQVHHGYGASVRRRADRVPLSLHEIAASTAVFLRRHQPEAALAETIPQIEHQRARIAALRAAGHVTADAAQDLHESLASGWDDGMTRPIAALPPLGPGAPFVALPATGPRPGLVLSGRIWHRARLLNHAKTAVAKGNIVTVICLEPTPRAHKMRFCPEGFWLQTGGIFGRADRGGPRVQLANFAGRVIKETARFAPFRPT